MMQPHGTGRRLLSLIVLAQPAAAQVAGVALARYDDFLTRKPFAYHVEAREALARTRAEVALQKLMADYAEPVAFASWRFEKPVVQDYARYTMATMFGEYYAKERWQDAIRTLRGKHASPGDVWLWVKTLATLPGEDGAKEAVELALGAKDVRIRGAAIAAMALRRRSEVLPLVPEICASLQKKVKKAERRLLIGALSNVILANKVHLREEPMQKAIRAYIGLLHQDYKLEVSTEAMIARHLAATIGKDQRYPDPEPWIELLDRDFEPPRQSGNTVSKPRFFGMDLEGERICYVIDLSNTMLKPVPGFEKGPITGPRKKKKRSRNQLPTEDDIPWHLVKTRFDVAREHLKISLQRLPKEKRFCIVWFGSDAGLLDSTPGMVQATRANVAKVIKDLDALGPLESPPKGKTMADAPYGWLRGETNLHAGIRRAFSVRSKGFAERHVDVDLRALEEGCDSIFLLSDGAPSTDDFEVDDKDYGDLNIVDGTEFNRQVARSKIVYHHGPMHEKRWILEDIQRLNLFRRLQIHCIAIGEADVKLMQEIAAANDGRFFEIGLK